jgi:hypothetical protein
VSVSVPKCLLIASYSSKLRRPRLVSGVFFDVVQIHDDVAAFDLVPEVVALRLIFTLGSTDGIVRQKCNNIWGRKTLTSDTVDQNPLAPKMRKQRLWIDIASRNLDAVDPDHVVTSGQEYLPILCVFFEKAFGCIVASDNRGVLWEVLHEF